MPKTPGKVSFTLRRLLSFLKMFTRNKRGIVGVSIIVFFCLVAILAPWITPYDTLGQDPENPNRALADINAAPTWLRYLPPALGGRPDLSEDMQINGTSHFNFTTPSPHISIKPAPIGNPKTGGTGSIAITYERDQKTPPSGEASAIFYHEFYFPFTGRPGRFQGDLALLVNGTTHKFIKYDYLDVPFEFYVFIQPEDGQRWIIYPYERFGTNPVKRPSTKWLLPRLGESPATYMDSSVLDQMGIYERPVRTIFSKTPCNYIWGVEIFFKDEDITDRSVETTVYMDDFNLQIYGTAFGLLGTDFHARDLFTQLVYGTRVSLYVGVLTSILGVVIGLIVGLSAGYLGRMVDELLMRFNDMLLVLPGLPLLIVLVAILGAKIENLILLLGLLGWMGFARTVRSQVLTIKERPFIEAAKAVGAGNTHIITKHVLPNVMSLVYVSLATSVPGAIVAEASLSWLGFWDATRMSWGRMLWAVQFEAAALKNWWWVLPPGLCIASLAIAFILIGYSLDEILNPRLRRRR